MKFGLINFFLSILFLIIFTFIVFWGGNETFSIRERIYAPKINFLENKLIEEIESIGTQIQKTINQKKNKNFINHILKYDFSLLRKNILFQDSTLKYMQIYNQKKKLVYYNEKLNNIKLSFEQDIFIRDKYLIFHFNYFDKKKGNLFFFYDFKKVLKKIFEKNQDFFKLANLDENLNLFNSTTIVFDYGDQPSIKEKVADQINIIQKKKLNYVKIFSNSEKKFILFKKIKFLELELAVLYPSNRMDVSVITIFLFFIIFGLISFSFFYVLDKLKYFLIDKIKKNFDKNRLSLKFPQIKKILTFTKNRYKWGQEKVYYFIKNFNNLKFKNQLKSSPSLPLRQDIVNLVKDINKLETQTKGNKKKYINIEETKNKLINNIVNIDIISSEKMIPWLEGLFNYQFSKIALLYPFNQKLFMIKEFKNTQKESIDKFIISKNDNIYKNYLTKKKIIILKKKNPHTLHFLNRNLSPQDIAEIDQLVIIPINQKNNIRFLILLAS